MVKRLHLFVALLILSGMSLTVPLQLVASQTIGEENDTEASASGSGAGLVSEDNTILLNATEVDEEQYRWTDNSGAENPTFDLVANNEYTVKISNPTDEEHELIIDSNADGKTSEIAKSGDIDPKDIVEFKFNTEEAEGLGYHCEYHPDMMNGTITVFAPS
jgi:hypothetical protein